MAHPLAGLCWAVGWDALGERIHSLWVHDEVLADRDRHAAELADAREAIKRLEADNDRMSTMLRISLKAGAGS